LSEDSFLRLRPLVDDWWAWLAIPWRGACPNESVGGAGKCGGGNLLLRPRPLRLLLVKSRAPSETEDELFEVEVVDSLALVKSAYGLV